MLDRVGRLTAGRSSRSPVGRLLAALLLPLAAGACMTGPTQAPVAQLAGGSVPMVAGLSPAVMGEGSATLADEQAAAPAGAVASPEPRAEPAPSLEAPVAPAEFVPSASGPVRIALTTATAAPPAARIEQAMRRMLTVAGYEVVAPPARLSPGDDIYLLVADIRVSPAEGGTEHVAIDWLLEDAAGEPLGKVSQERRLKANPDWDRLSMLAAAAATEGVGDLVRARR